MPVRDGRRALRSPSLHTNGFQLVGLDRGGAAVWHRRSLCDVRRGSLNDRERGQAGWLSASLVQIEHQSRVTDWEDERALAEVYYSEVGGRACACLLRARSAGEPSAVLQRSPEIRPVLPAFASESGSGAALRIDWSAAPTEHNRSG
jgi:hypothetical protein